MMQRYLIVIPAAQQKLANAAAHVIDPGGGDNFTVPLVAAGGGADDAKASAYWCCWQMEESEHVKLMAEFTKRAVTAKSYIDARGPSCDENRTTEKKPEAVLTAERLKVRSTEKLVVK